jgi:hypothetical protein
MTRPVEPLPIVPDARGPVTSNGARKPKVEAYLTRWKADQLAEEDAAQLKKAQAALREALCRALGLSWIDPDHTDDYANEAGVSPDTLRKLLAMEKGQSIAAAMASKLRSSGEATRVQAGRIMGSLLDLIEQGVADGTVTGATAPKILDTVAKLRGTTEARNARTPPAPFGGSAAGLLGHD